MKINFNRYKNIYLFIHKNMENSVITLTFGDVGENHKGMQMIGKIVEK